VQPGAEEAIQWMPVFGVVAEIAPLTMLQSVLKCFCVCGSLAHLYDQLNYEPQDQHCGRPENHIPRIGIADALAVQEDVAVLALIAVIWRVAAIAAIHAAVKASVTSSSWIFIHRLTPRIKVTTVLRTDTLHFIAAERNIRTCCWTCYL